MIASAETYIANDVVGAAGASLQDEIDRKRQSGDLDAGKKTVEQLQSTPQVKEVVQRLAGSSSAILNPLLQQLGFAATARSERLLWGGPFVYAEPSDPPLQYDSSSQTYAVVGIIALDRLQLPTIGGQTMRLGAGSVALFKGDVPIKYTGCQGRGILFWVKI